MQAAQSSTVCTDLFVSLQSVQSTVQSQVEHFHELMTDIKHLSAIVQDEEGVRFLGEVALKLQRVHALLFGGAAAQPSANAVETATAIGGGGDMQNALAEFSSLLAASQNTSMEVAMLLGKAGEELSQLRTARAA